MEERLNQVKAFIDGMMAQDDVGKMYKVYGDAVGQLTPRDVFRLMSSYEAPPSEVLPFVDKLVNVFYKPLKAYEWKRPSEHTFLYYLTLENDGLTDVLEQYKKLSAEQNTLLDPERVLTLLDTCALYNSHLLKLENILFPYLERASDDFRGVKILWSMHDATRQLMKDMRQTLSEITPDYDLLNAQLGALFFKLYGLIQKQTLILFPAASTALDEKTFEAMHLQSFDYEFPYIEAPVRPAGSLKTFLGEAGEKETGEKTGEETLSFETGRLTVKQIEMLINHLPADMTFVDAFDKVAFFSNGKHRIFPRSVAVIGRDVRNCHPAESVHVVEKILEDFKSGAKDQEDFWLQMNGQFILIQYFAVRDESGIYMGTLEVSQEISDIKALTGEKRLLSESE